MSDMKHAPERRAIGTPRDIAEKNIRRFDGAVRTGRGHPLVVREMRDKWLDYFASHQKNGTLDEEQYL